MVGAQHVRVEAAAPHLGTLGRVRVVRVGRHKVVALGLGLGHCRANVARVQADVLDARAAVGLQEDVDLVLCLAVLLLCLLLLLVSDQRLGDDQIEGGVLLIGRRVHARLGAQPVLEHLDVHTRRAGAHHQSVGIGGGRWRCGVDVAAKRPHVEYVAVPLDEARRGVRVRRVRQVVEVGEKRRRRW